MQAIKNGFCGHEQIGAFIQALRDGEQTIADEDSAQGRDRSLAASLNYGFAHAFTADELPIIALLHLFQGVVNVFALVFMGKAEGGLAELQGKDEKHIASLLLRAGDIGLLTPIDDTWHRIHPALPWFLRQAFKLHYDGKEGRSSINTALQAWVVAIGEMVNYYSSQFINGNREVILLLCIEEANMLHARRLARKHGRWDVLILVMQGLGVFYQYQGRSAEWSQLVTDIVPDYCTSDDMPIAGREDAYTLVMENRVRLAQYYDRDLSLAAALQN